MEKILIYGAKDKHSEHVQKYTFSNPSSTDKTPKLAHFVFPIMLGQIKIYHFISIQHGALAFLCVHRCITFYPCLLCSIFSSTVVVVVVMGEWMPENR